MSEHRDARRVTSVEIGAFFALLIGGMIWTIWRLPPDLSLAGLFGPLFMIEIYLRLRGPLVMRRPWARRLTRRKEVDDDE